MPMPARNCAKTGSAVASCVPSYVFRAPCRFVQAQRLYRVFTPNACILAELTAGDAEARGAFGYMQQPEAAVVTWAVRTLVRGSPATPLERGSDKQRIVVRDFSSREAAKAFYNGPQYALTSALRQNLSNARLMRLDGYEPGRPNKPGP